MKRYNIKGYKVGSKLNKAKQIEKELTNSAELHEIILADYDARYDLMTRGNQIEALKKENARLKEEINNVKKYLSELDPIRKCILFAI